MSERDSQPALKRELACVLQDAQAVETRRATKSHGGRLFNAKEDEGRARRKRRRRIRARTHASSSRPSVFPFGFFALKTVNQQRPLPLSASPSSPIFPCAPLCFVASSTTKPQRGQPTTCPSGIPTMRPLRWWTVRASTIGIIARCLIAFGLMTFWLGPSPRSELAPAVYDLRRAVESVGAAGLAAKTPDQPPPRLRPSPALLPPRAINCGSERLMPRRVGSPSMVREPEPESADGLKRRPGLKAKDRGPRPRRNRLRRACLAPHPRGVAASVTASPLVDVQANRPARPHAPGSRSPSGNVAVYLRSLGVGL